MDLESVLAAEREKQFEGEVAGNPEQVLGADFFEVGDQEIAQFHVSHQR